MRKMLWAASAAVLAFASQAQAQETLIACCGGGFSLDRMLRIA